MADILEGRVANPKRPWQGWQVGLHSLTKSSKSKCQVLQRYEDNPKHGHYLGHERIESSPEKEDLEVSEEEDLEVLVNEKLNVIL